MKKNRIKIVEAFHSIQGEGEYAGVPAFFIRVAGCNRRCPWCDTKYSWKPKMQEVTSMTADKLAEVIIASQSKIIVFTGGEPLLYFDVIKEVIKKVRDLEFRKDYPYHYFHLETNGDFLIKDGRIDYEKIGTFDYIVVSPKDEEVAEKLKNAKWLIGEKVKIKVVTDLKKVGLDLVPYADMLMPLTTGDEKKDREIAQRVWKFCTENNIRFSPRLQVWVWGNKRGR